MEYNLNNFSFQRLQLAVDIPKAKKTTNNHFQYQGHQDTKF